MVAGMEREGWACAGASGPHMECADHAAMDPAEVVGGMGLPGGGGRRIGREAMMNGPDGLNGLDGPLFEPAPLSFILPCPPPVPDLTS